MSHAAVERTLGKLLTDEAFRDRFFADPAVASFTAGLVLSTAELDALSRLPREALSQLSRRLDDRIRRLRLDQDEGLLPEGGLGAPGPSATPERPVIGAARQGPKRGVG
jgi:hypothetical protein